MRKMRKIVPVFLVVIMLVTTFAFAAPSSYSIAFHALCQQPYDQLCWAGVCAGVINTYNNESMSVTDVARLIYPVNSLNQGLPLFNFGGTAVSSIQQVLESKGIVGSSEQTEGMVIETYEITECIYDNESPVVVALKKMQDSASHAVLVNGYAENVNTYEYFVSVSDPWLEGDLPNEALAKSKMYSYEQIKDSDYTYGGIITANGRYYWNMSLYNFSANN